MVRRLLSIGILVTWAVGTVAAYLLFNLSFQVALVLGAVLVVSGPTVVGPLLSFIRPSKTVNSVLMWEGTFADPLGATLGVLVFNAVIAGHAKAGQEVGQFLLAIVIGAGFGLAGAVLILAWARWFKPNQSQAVTGTLMFVVAVVVGADLIRDDTGLITGLVMGAILVNRPPRGIEPQGLAIAVGKAHARLARADRHPHDVPYRDLVHHPLRPRHATPDRRDRLGEPRVHRRARAPRSAVRRGALDPALGLQIRERAFIAWMAPRGIVAAATSSTFALGLTQAVLAAGQTSYPDHLHRDHRDRADLRPPSSGVVG